MNTEETAPTFAELGLRDDLLQTLAAQGYEAPTPIQAKTIPVFLSGKDLIGQAQTGTGKTAAFALPILQRLDPEDRSTQALVLAPTRELAMQVAEAFHTYARSLPHVSVLPVYGGAPMHVQLRHLERGAQIVVGTPGRLIDHLERGTLRLGSTRTVVLDEADEMLRMGFLDDVEKILSRAPSPRQTALFSATMPNEIKRIAERYLTDPVRIAIEHHTVTAPMIEQRYLSVAEWQKLDVLTQMLELEANDAVLIFRRTKTGAAELAEKLEARGFAAQAMHGDMTQSLRESVIRRLKAGQVEIVVATDVAARGLDVEQISHVVNYDVPYDEESYVHRIGRTGRAGRSGVATLFVTPRERRMMRDIERYTGSAIKPMKIPSRADVAAKRVAVFKETLIKNLEQGNLDLYIDLVQQVAAASGADVVDVAAAAARLANGSRSLAPEPEPPAVVEQRPAARTADRNDRKKPAPRDFAPGPARQERRPEQAARPERPRADDARPARKPAEGRRHDEPKVKLAMALGSNDGLRAADVVGSIANEGGVPGRDIGPIEIGDEATIVTIPAKHADDVIRKLARARFRGHAMRLRLADEAPAPRASSKEGTAPPRSRAPKAEKRRDDERTAAPRKPFYSRVSGGGGKRGGPRGKKGR